MLVPSGEYQVWPGFSLHLTADLDFCPGLHYLSGPNGSGKSSFLTRLLLPRLLQDADAYSLYLEQQMHLQVNAVKAYASVLRPHARINGEADTVDFLLQNLLRAWQTRPKACFVAMDESPHAAQVHAFLSANLPAFSLIFSSHHPSLPAGQTIVFQPLSPSRSEVHAS